MSKSYEIIWRLTDPELAPSHRREELKRFADENSWLPSDEIDEYPGTETFANGHLIVEHGLDNTAVITFLKRNTSFGQLKEEEKIRLLSISYNNLVEWHFFPDIGGLTRVFNRIKSISEGTKYISINDEKDVWRAEAFDRITGKRPNPNVKGLDDALMDTISFWKRALASELEGEIRNENISSLFNSLLFARALEDYKRGKTPNSAQLLVDKWIVNRQRLGTIRSCIMSCIRDMGTGNIPRGLFDQQKLKVFDALDHDTVLSILRDFYINKFARYHYDFSLMSKHALSRIYEHYVSLLSREDSAQLTLFPDLPRENRNRIYGGIYTPQYIARFFVRYLKQNLTPVVFRGLKTADPACGSGIFLRTILEIQCDPFQEVDMREPTEKAFLNTFGLDRDENACQATRLSLYLLHLILTDNFPKHLKIIHSEAIKYFNNHKELANSYDVVIANPPFIKWENIYEADRTIVSKFMANYRMGKVDMYQAFLKLGMLLLKEGGYLLYVLPHSFLLTKNSEKLRKEISSDYWIHYVVDLSEVDVFEGVGSYVILLIIQKKYKREIRTGRTVIVRCRELPGRALQSAIEGKRISTDLYDIYEINQAAFTEEQWLLLGPKQITLKTKLRKFPTVDEFLTIRVGFNTGANRIFIRDASDITPEEMDAYIPYLQDREMEKYGIPTSIEKVVFYPYIEGKKIKAKELKDKFPKTWLYLNKNSDELKKRKAVVSGNCEWWSPERSRLPQNMLRPKIITPHLTMFPKFSLDQEGKYGISRSPLMYPKKPEQGLDLLYYFLAVLNSSVVYWQIANMSHKYRGGYLMLEPKTLKRLHVPGPAEVPTSKMKKIHRLVKERIQKVDLRIENEIDNIITDIYAISGEDKNVIGIGE